MANRRTTLGSIPLTALNSRQSLGPARISSHGDGPVKSRVSLAGGSAVPQMMMMASSTASAAAAASTANNNNAASAVGAGSSRMSMGGLAARRASIGVTR